MGIFANILNIIIPSRKKLQMLAFENKRLESFLRSVPIEYCGWNKVGTKAISPKFTKLLEIDKIETVLDIENALATSDAAAFDGMYARLAEYGEPFQIEVFIANKRKQLKLIGKRGAITNMNPDDIFDVIWAIDITEENQKISKILNDLNNIEKKEKKWRNVINSMPFPVWLRKANLNIQWCNNKYKEILDTSSTTIVSEQLELPSTSTKRGSFKDKKGTKHLAQKALGTSNIQRENRHLVVDGKRKLVDIWEIPDLQTSKDFILGLAYDITKVENIKLELKHHISNHQEVLEHLRTALAVFDSEARLEFYNTAYEQLWGFSGKWLNTKPKITEILEKRRSNRKLPEQSDFKKFRQKWLDMFESLLEPYEEMQYLPDGTALRMIAVPRPMGGVIITYEDVTSRLELETSYNTLLAVQKETLDNLNEGLAVFGEDGCLKLWNPKFSEIWSLPPEYLDKKPHITDVVEKLVKYFDEDSWENIKEIIVQNGLDRNFRKDRIKCTNGDVLEYTVIPLPDGNILNGYFDVTEEAHVEEALREKNAALEETERLKLDFLANVSYQLRTPLNAISGFTEILNNEYFGNLNERQKEYTEAMMKACTRLSNLIDDILDLSTIEAGYMELNFEEINICEIIKSTYEITEEWARKHNIHINTKCPKNIGKIKGDKRRIKQILLKLISNSISFSPDGGKIDIIAKKDKNNISITIKDTGVGIEKEVLDKIFSPFEKAGFSKKQNAGAGLGLSIVKKLIDLHGGDINIKSQIGKGTEVTCIFPIAN